MNLARTKTVLRSGCAESRTERVKISTSQKKITADDTRREAMSCDCLPSLSRDATRFASWVEIGLGEGTGKWEGIRMKKNSGNMIFMVILKATPEMRTAEKIRFVMNT